MPVDQLRIQLDVRLFSTWHRTRPGVGILARKNRLVIHWYSFLGQEYSFFSAIVSCLMDVMTLKSQNDLWALPPDTAQRLFPRSQTAITIPLHLLFPL